METSTSTIMISAEELDRLFDEGEEDILQYFDLSSVERPGRRGLETANGSSDGSVRAAQRPFTVRSSI